MYKIRKITFDNHPSLGNLSLDFCGKDGKTVDTVILAGENGTGKSTIIEALYRITTFKADYPLKVEIESNDAIVNLTFYQHQVHHNETHLFVMDNKGLNTIVNSSDVKNRYPFCSIFSDVDINFSTEEISSVTSLNLDEQSQSRRSNNNLPKQIKQLLIDIQALDDGDVAKAVRDNPDTPKSQLNITERMPRFTNAFNRMFDELTYSHIENQNNHKSVLFKKYGKEIPIDKLSSGEKQIVYRGSFLLKDVNALNGAFVFIDEPEISLHPAWQKR